MRPGRRSRRADRELPPRCAGRPGNLAPDDLLAANPRLIVLAHQRLWTDRPLSQPSRLRRGGRSHGRFAPPHRRTRPRAGAGGREPGDTLAAPARRDRHPAGAAAPPVQRARPGRSTWPLYGAVFNCMESLLPEYSAFGAVRGWPARAARHRPPTPTLPRRRLRAGGRQRRQHLPPPDDADRPRRPGSLTPAGRQRRRVARGESTPPSVPWTASRSVDEVLAALDGASGACRPHLHTVADIAATRQHYQARGMLDTEKRWRRQRRCRAGICPKLSATPGRHRNAPTGGRTPTASCAKWV